MAKPLVVVAVTEDVRLVEADVAGHPASHYLLDQLRLAGDVHVEIALAPGTTAPAWSANYQAFSAELPPECDVVVIVDARAWLASGSLAALIGTVRATNTLARLLESPPGRDVSRGQAQTLAAAFPARLFPEAMTRGLSQVDQFLTSTWIDAGVEIATSELLDAEPSRLLASTVDLAAVEEQVVRQRAMAALRAGVRLRDPQSLRIRGDLVCGAGVEIDVDVIVEGLVTLEDGVKIGAHSILRQARIGKHTRIEPYSLVEGATVGESSVVGPYGRLRPGSTLGHRVQIGNYVEIKNSRIGAGCRINHHSFIGDADLADNVTIGAGTITCNHDGAGSVPTVIERDVYIGSGCKLVAPLRIGEKATIGAGSTITRDVPPGKLTLARSRQTTIDNWQGPRSRRQSRP